MAKKSPTCVNVIPIVRKLRGIAGLIALTLSALGLRLALIPTRQLVENDGPYYIALAGQILRGELSGALNDYWSQLYPVLIALAGLFIHDIELAARLVSAVCGAALVPAVWSFVNEIAGPVPAYLAALLTVFQPWLLLFSILALTEMTFALLVVTALILILRAGRLGGLGRFILAGTLTGLAILARPEGLLLAMSLLGVSIIRLVRHWGWHSGRESLAALAALVMVMAPQTIGTYRIYGHFNFMWKSSISLALGDTFPDPSLSEQSVYSLDDLGQRQFYTQASQMSLSQYWLEHSSEAALRVRDNSVTIWRAKLTVVLMPMPWTSEAATLGMGLLVVVGIVTGLRGEKRGSLLVVLAFVGAYSLGLLSVLVHHRLLMPLIPFSLSFIALGCSGVAQAVQRTAARSLQPDWWRVTGMASLLAISIASLWAAYLNFTWVYARRDPISSEPVAQKEAGLWLRANMPQTAKLLSHNPQTPFYFYEGWPFDRALSLPWADPEEVLAYARHHHVDLILLEEWVIRPAHFPVEHWLETDQPHPGLKLLKIFGATPYRVIIYQRVE